MAVNRLDAIRDPIRLAALRSTGLWGTVSEETYDRITRLATRALRVPICLFSLIDATEQYLKSQQGLAEPWASRRTIPLTHSFCWLVVGTGEPLAVVDGRQHPLLEGSPAIDELGAVAYLGMPITVDGGHVVGALAAIDRQPRQWSDGDVRTLEDLASLTTTELNRNRPAATGRATVGAGPSIQVLESLGDGVCAVDRSGRCTFVNQTGARMLGYRPSEVVGQPLHELIHHSFPDGSAYPPGDTPIMRALATGDPFRIEGETIWRRDLTPLSVRYAAFPILEDGQVAGAVVVFADATDRRRAEEERQRILAEAQALRQEAETVQRRMTFLARASTVLAGSLDEASHLRSIARLIVPHLADWCTIDLVDRGGSLRRAEAAHRDASRTPLLRAIPDRFADGPIWERSVRSVIQTGQAELVADVGDRDLFAASREPADLQVLRAVGCRSYLCAPLIARDATLGAITLAQVEPDRRFRQIDLFFAEDLARRVAAALDNSRLYREARDAVRARNEFLVTVAHDLRNPLANIKGYSQLILRSFAALKSAENAEMLDWLQKVDTMTTRMTSQIDELLDLARTQIGQPLELERRPMDLVSLAEQVADGYRQSGDHQRVRVEAAVPSLIGFWDARRLERALSNLVSNAIKYGREDGEVTISIGVEELNGHPWAVLSVADHGVGIPAADLPRVFERFYRGRNVARQSPGAGVGLASVHQIVTHHGGTVDVASEEGVGTTVTIRLPLSPPPAAASPTPGESSA